MSFTTYFQLTLLGLALFANGSATSHGGEFVDSQLLSLLPKPAQGCGQCVQHCKGGCSCCGWDLDSSLRRLGPCDGACDPRWVAGRLWFRGEYLAWDTKGYDLPALVTTGSSATPATDVGQLDQSDTTILFGDSTVQNDFRSGGRLTVGSWFTPEQISGVELSFFGIGGRDINFKADSEAYPVLAKPFVDADSGDHEALLVAYPGLLEGSTSAQVDFELVGAEALVRRSVYWKPKMRIDVLAGYRHGWLRDSLQTSDTSFSLDAASGYPVDAIIDRSDLFRVVNDFHGGQLGLSGRWWRNCWSLSALGKVALGGVQSRYRIAGDTAVSELVNGEYVTTEYEGGLLALPTNIGTETFHNTAVMTEINLSLEYQIRHDIRLGIGYTFLGWSDVMRLESVIQTEINPTQIPPGVLSGDPLPAAPSFEKVSFWAQGLNASFEYAF
jgi:hypothetical protein